MYQTNIYTDSTQDLKSDNLKDKKIKIVLIYLFVWARMITFAIILYDYE